MNFSIIVGANNNNGIGLNGDLLYKSKTDMDFFKEITTTVHNSKNKNAVIMGRKTWESIPVKFRPLPDRLNVILTENNSQNLKNLENENIIIMNNLPSSLEKLSKIDYIENIFIIGGERLYKEAINNKYCQYIYFTNFNRNDLADTYFPIINSKNFELISECKKDNSICKYLPLNQNITVNLNFKLYKSLMRFIN